MTKNKAPQRRGNGEGTIYFDERSSRWISELQWTDPGGRTRRKSAKRETKSAARVVLSGWKADLLQHLTLPTADVGMVTIGMAVERFLDEARGRVRPSTITMYEAIAKHVAPIWDRRIATVMRAHIRDVLERAHRKTQSSGKKPAKPLSKRTKSLIHLVLKASLRPYSRLIAFEEVFPRRSGAKAPKRQMTVWTRKQTDAFLTSCQYDRYYPLYLLALATGMRQGEMLGLQWRHFKPGHVSVAGTLERATRTIAEPKTKGSSRRVELTKDVEVALRKHRKRMKAEYLDVTDTAFVFQSPSGATVDPRGLLRQFRTRIKEASIPAIRFHDLRHTNASLLFEANVHPKVVAERLGHASVQLTLDTYSHLLPGMQATAKAALSGLGGKSPRKSLPKPNPYGWRKSKTPENG